MSKVDSLTVTLCLGSQLFQKQLAMKLQSLGMLRRVISFGVELEIFDPGGTEHLKLVHRFNHYRLANRILWGVWRRLPGAGGCRNFPVVLSVSTADHLASRWVPFSTVFHGCAGVCLTSIQSAKRHGSVILIENATMHPCSWQKAVLEECDTFGVPARDCRALLPSPLIKRMEREYDLCDYIIVPSRLAQQSFEMAGHKEKAIVVHAGVDHLFFAPSTAPREDGAFRVCYVGRIELAKGVPYILKAWKQLRLVNAELILVGELAKEMNGLIKQYELPNVRFTGMLSPSKVAERYRSSDLFVFPSVNEGLARVLFEAMSSGLPVVATDRSGAEDCVTNGVDGVIVPARSADALAEAILWQYQNRKAGAAMGRAAREKIEQRFTLSHYEARMISVYRSAAQRRYSSDDTVVLST